MPKLHLTDELFEREASQYVKLTFSQSSAWRKRK
jgi:hypothetical protein